MSKPRETDLYAPLKAFLVAQGYEVKAEVAAADLVACRGDEEPVIVEMKTGFTLSLFHQAVARQAISDLVYIAVPRGTGRRYSRSLAENRAMCRRLGLGLLTVRLRDGLVEPHLDPAPYQPRKSVAHQQLMLREFARRVGDPNTGGMTRAKLVTAYRQDALRCAAHLRANGPTKGAHVARACEVPNATRIMATDHYGWFHRISPGIYDLTPKGTEALGVYSDTLAMLEQSP
ncbi:DUF2161 domain-containing phosphodiesterase [Actibacterium sp. XHP0104]|uniref:DUF2161 domain-containing phosphodiesterase n=1 Tax=Actibacterium sp. XHP0104 TaxID=2984335 RepID=UPI0021E7F1FC|nr:DUF2161 family putative PD-(D/E)XK-type phosphodiesterase [Actibacterium sp. XHP0104]MCV2882259.1 DUF2161 family putative PD-(D/E)XK-type phosphodiesterase [Actibacterium sp. XHP0104]